MEGFEQSRCVPGRSPQQNRFENHAHFGTQYLGDVDVEESWACIQGVAQSVLRGVANRFPPD